MKITLHQAIAATPYATPTFEGLDKQALIRQVADICRKDWPFRTWPEEVAPPVPESDQEVLNVYFGDPDEEDLDFLAEEPDYYLGWREYEIDLAAPHDVPVDLSVDGPCSITRLTGGGVLVEGELLQKGEKVNEPLERLCMSLTGAGFPVHHPEFRRCLKEVCAALADRMGDLDEDEVTEREMADRDLLLQFDESEHDWAIAYFDATGCVMPWRVAAAERFKKRQDGVRWMRDYFASK